MDREKVIAQLTADMDVAKLTGESLVHITRETVMNVLALLREQEPKWGDYEDTFTGEKFKVPLCGNCESLIGDALYCPMCGRKVKWDET